MERDVDETKSRMADFFLEQASAKLKLQVEWANDLDTKASILIGFAGVMLTTAADTAPASAPVRVLVIIGLLAAVGLGLYAYRLTKYQVPPDMTQLWQKYYGKNEIEVKETLTSTLVQACQENQNRVEEKAKRTQAAQNALFAALFLFVVDQLIALLN
jgi:hypothetical protein